MKIFNEPIEEDDSCSESPTSCFVAQARRRLRSRFKKIIGNKETITLSDKDESTSTSIGETESLSSKEINENKLIYIDVEDDSSDELILPKLGENRRKGKKHNKITKFFTALWRIFWPRKKSVMMDFIFIILVLIYLKIYFLSPSIFRFLLFNLSDI